MDTFQQHILKKLRNYLSENGDLKKLKNIDNELYQDTINRFNSIENVVDKILKEERDGFQDIFEKYNFNGMNAIDILLIVSQKINKRFYKINPFISARLQNQFPDIYNKHINERMDFVYEKIQINITKGISQGIYRSDISIEMIARMYITRLQDLHQTEMFNPDTSNFVTVFNTLINDFIMGIAKEEGIKYYKQRKQFFSILSFGQDN